MNTNRLPPLKSLRAFESAARHLSLSKAAKELFVTPGAISQQVKLLEEFLGIELFKRKHRRILLTDAGQCLLPGLQLGFDNMISAVNEIKLMDQDRPVTISVAPSFASKWLVPRLGLLREEHPDIDIRIDTSINLIDLSRSDIDIAIRFGRGNYPGMQTDLLLCQNVFPVCSPDLITDTHPLDQPQDLKHFPLLHYDTGKDLDAGWPNWQMWLMAAGATDIDTRHGSTLDQHEMLVQAAVQGQGVALVGSVAVTDDINSGRLVKPFELSFPLELAFYFVTTPTKSQWPKIVAVREWIFSQAKKVLNAQDL